MNINELFKKIQLEFVSEEINGEYILDENIIIWSYDLNNNNYDSEYIDDDDDYENNNFNFEATTIEEYLMEAYQEDYELLQDYLDNIEENENWEFSDTEIIENKISYKIT